MEFLHSFILGIIQGLTEFLPISSSAHLAVFPDILGIRLDFLDSLAFTVALHAGTLVAVIFYFRKKLGVLIVSFFRGIKDSGERKTADFKMGMYIIAATIPAVIAGLFFEGLIEDFFRNCNLCIAVILIIFGALLLFADKKGGKERQLGAITLKDALIIGLFQALAVFPGVSRSGITMTAALFKGYRREDAAEFSFLLSIPVILGAVALKSKEILAQGGGENLIALAIGFVTALVSGFFAIKFLLNFVKKFSYASFAVYRFVLGAAIILLAVLKII